VRLHCIRTETEVRLQFTANWMKKKTNLDGNADTFFYADCKINIIMYPLIKKISKRNIGTFFE
jgi:hypothetical protein